MLGLFDIRVAQRYWIINHDTQHGTYHSVKQCQSWSAVIRE